jgi:hypothetical protein
VTFASSLEITDRCPRPPAIVPSPAVHPTAAIATGDNKSDCSSHSQCPSDTPNHGWPQGYIKRLCRGPRTRRMACAEDQDCRIPHAEDYDLSNRPYQGSGPLEQPALTPEDHDPSKGTRLGPDQGFHRLRRPSLWTKQISRCPTRWIWVAYGELR